ncbi:ATP-grasp domain-containing protein [Mycobacterium shinjukuense]|uniref:ATP-grasp domain-containing protein n=1 Tax=Mycobacterium shinjukuense TaxID=398694 RepID=A0A7I7MV42_9MYCO|nr:ATP-grasp domain-containing protein [Mycobacterium shinjukuense]BBX76168.1 ATP-grasp domain-containing protein [Mycobacterium shinjukuense]
MSIHESRRQHLVLVDTYGPSASRLAPAFQAAGYLPIRVQSTPETPRLYRNCPDPFRYTFEFIHRGSVAETVNAILPFHPVAVIAGCDHGVELADALSEALHPLTGAPTNGTALSAARRDKYLMIERIKECGLRGARQITVHSEDQLWEWHTRLGGMAILKPLRSAANDGVSWCRTPEDSIRAFRRLNGRTNVVNLPNDGVVAQEYLIGAEYLVNTVSREGLHHVCDIWKTHRISANGVADLVVACHLLPFRGEVQDRLVPYALDVLDALDIRYGAAHIEIKMTPDGPCLVEVGARVAGQDLPGYTAMATGESQIEWLVDAYTDPDRFRQRHGRPYELVRSVAWALMVAPRSGVLACYRGLDAIKALESFYEMRLLVQPGQRLHRTIDDSTYPVSLTLMHEVDEILLRDLATLRYLDGEGFYELTDGP